MNSTISSVTGKTRPETGILTRYISAAIPSRHHELTFPFPFFPLAPMPRHLPCPSPAFLATCHSSTCSLPFAMTTICHLLHAAQHLAHTIRQTVCTPFAMTTTCHLPLPHAARLRYIYTIATLPQLHRMANTAYETPPRHQRVCSRSPPHTEPSRKCYCSHSPHHNHGSHLTVWRNTPWITLGTPGRTGLNFFNLAQAHTGESAQFVSDTMNMPLQDVKRPSSGTAQLAQPGRTSKDSWSQPAVSCYASTGKS